MDDHVKIFWDERRKLYGGRIQFRSFARLLGGGGDKGEDLSGLLYLVGEQLIFEDFEKEGGFLGLFMKKFKGEYKKTLIKIPAGDIHTIKRVGQRGARRQLAGKAGPAKPISKLLAALVVVVHEITLNNGRRFYFEIMDKGSLEEVLNK